MRSQTNSLKRLVDGKMIHWDKRTLTILVLSVLAVLLFALGCLVTYHKLRNERQHDKRAEARRMLLACEAHSTRLFDYTDGQLRAIRSYLNEHGNDENLVNFIHEIKVPRAEIFTGIIHVVDRDGWLVYQSETPKDQLKALGKMSDLDHYQYFIKHPGDSLFIGATRLGRVTGKLQYRLARPILKNGVFDGLVVLTLRPEHIVDFFHSTSLGLHSTVTMMTQDWKLIARQPSVKPEMYGHAISNLSKTYGINTAPGGGSSVFGIVSAFDQVRRDFFYKNLTDYPVTLVIGIDGEDRDETLAGLRRNLTLLAGAFTLFSILVCALILRMVSQNRQLVNADTASLHLLSQLRRLFDHQKNITEQERKRIARDIHDDLGQNLLALKMEVATLCVRTGNKHSKLNQRALLVLNNINATIKSVKSIMNDLRPATLELGLFAGVEWQLKQFERMSGIACKLVATEEAEFGLDDKRALEVFRIFQESLTNVARHAEATKVEVTLCRDERGFSMTVKDNGKGLEQSDTEKVDSFGLMGIKERTQALECEFTIESSPGNGTALSILIALDERSTTASNCEALLTFQKVEPWFLIGETVNVTGWKVSNRARVAPKINEDFLNLTGKGILRPDQYPCNNAKGMRS